MISHTSNLHHNNLPEYLEFLVTADIIFGKEGWDYSTRLDSNSNKYFIINCCIDVDYFSNNLGDIEGNIYDNNVPVSIRSINNGLRFNYETNKIHQLDIPYEDLPDSYKNLYNDMI